MPRNRYAVESYRRRAPGQPGMTREWFRVYNRRTGKPVRPAFPEHEEHAAFALAAKLNKDRI